MTASRANRPGCASARSARVSASLGAVDQFNPIANVFNPKGRSCLNHCFAVSLFYNCSMLSSPFVSNQHPICSLNHFLTGFRNEPTIHNTKHNFFRKNCPTFFTLFCFQSSVCCLVSLNLRFDCTLALRLSKKTVFATFLGSLLGNTNFYFHRPIISGALSHSLSCWPQQFFFKETSFPTHSPNHQSPPTAPRLSHLSSNYALLHFKQTWHSTNCNTTHCFNPKIVLQSHFSFLLIYAKKNHNSTTADNDAAIHPPEPRRPSSVSNNTTVVLSH